MFIQRKKVALLLLIFIAIPITIVFSAFKLSASKAAIAADENKTEYTLSDFVTVPDDGLDFNSKTYSSQQESLTLKVGQTFQSLNFAFSLQLNEEISTSSKTIYFCLTNISCLKFDIKSSGFTATLVENIQQNKETIFKTSDCLKDCQPRDLIVFKIVVVAKENIALQVSCGNKECEGNIKYSATINKLLLWCKGLKSAKLYNNNANIKNTTLTVKNESGDIVSSVNKKALTRSEIVKAVETEQKKFIGFEYDSKLYKTADEIETINKNAVVTAKTMTLYMEYGARIRTIEPFGIRFAAVASYSVADYGIMLTTKDIAKNSDLFTLENLENSDVNYKIACKSQSKFKELLDKETGLSNFAIALVGTKGVRKANYNLVFAARAFAKIKYADGSVGTVYSNFGDDNCRSLYDVASKGLKNSNDKENYALYRDYCDGVIDITISKHESNILINMGYKSDLYSVKTTVENDNKTLSITFADVKDGYDIADNVKCITINGKRIVGFKYDGGKIQIDITEFLS